MTDAIFNRSWRVFIGFATLAEGLAIVFTFGFWLPAWKWKASLLYARAAMAKRSHNAGGDHD